MVVGQRKYFSDEAQGIPSHNFPRSHAPAPVMGFACGPVPAVPRAFADSIVPIHHLRHPTNYPLLHAMILLEVCTPLQAI